MFCKNKYVDLYILELCNRLNIEIILSSKLKGCNGLNYLYNNKNYIIINSNLSEEIKIFSVLHEISHIQLNYMGEKYEKKGANSLSEKIVNLNLIYRNKKIIKNRLYILLYLYAIISEYLLTKNIIFGGKNV